MERRTFLTLLLVLVFDEVSHHNEVVRKINKLGDEGVALIVKVNKILTYTVDASGRNRDARLCYHRLSEVYTEMGALFQELAD